MTRMMKNTLPLAILAAGLISAPLALAAQIPEPGAENAARIASLEERADILLASADFERAAAVLRRAADLRAPADAKGVRDLSMAARLSYYAGRGADAVRYFRNAGNRAIAIGDVVAAAQAFLDGAWIACKQGRSDEARQMRSRAHLLSHSPLITESERTLLKARLRSVVDGKADAGS